MYCTSLHFFSFRDYMDHDIDLSLAALEAWRAKVLTCADWRDAGLGLSDHWAGSTNDKVDWILIAGRRICSKYGMLYWSQALISGADRCHVRSDWFIERRAANRGGRCSYRVDELRIWLRCCWSPVTLPMNNKSSQRAQASAICIGIRKS